MAERTAEQAVRGYWQDVWCAGDPEAPGRYYADGATENGDLIDAADFGQAVATWFTKFPDFTATVDEVLVLGDRVVSRVTYRGTHQGTFWGLPASGRRFSVLGLDVFTVVDGRIVEHWHSTDHYDMVIQIGGTVVPSGAGAG